MLVKLGMQICVMKTGDLDGFFSKTASDFVEKNGILMTENGLKNDISIKNE